MCQDFICSPFTAGVRSGGAIPPAAQPLTRSEAGNASVLFARALYWFQFTVLTVAPSVMKQPRKSAPAPGRDGTVKVMF